MNLLVIREEFYRNTTIGKLFINGEFFCHTLEDAIRGEGIKIPAFTGIPAGEYDVKLSNSSRFQRLMPMVYTEINEYEIKKGGIEFKGVRIHGGNTHRNTEGCILVAHNRVDDEVIQGTAEKDLVNILLESGENKFKLIIKNR